MQHLLHVKNRSWLLAYGRRLLLIIIIFLMPAAVAAQEGSQPSRYQFLTVDLWPDYDRPELLVILNGGLAPETPLPATVTLSLPENASINAVARVDIHNVLIDDMAYEVNNNTLVFTTPDLSFQVEYYQPYNKSDETHEINFRWTAPLPIQQFLITVQEPFAATEFTLSQDILQIQRNSDNLSYHVLPAQTLTAGQQVALDVTYRLPDGSLSSTVAQPALAEPVSEDTAVSINPDNWWLYALGSVLLIFSLVMIGSGVRDQVQTSRASKPKRKRGLICSACGQAVGKGDKFCGHCGTAL